MRVVPQIASLSWIVPLFFSALMMSCGPTVNRSATPLTPEENARNKINAVGFSRGVSAEPIGDRFFEHCVPVKSMTIAEAETALATAGLYSSGQYLKADGTRSVALVGKFHRESIFAVELNQGADEAGGLSCAVIAVLNEQSPDGLRARLLAEPGVLAAKKPNIASNISADDARLVNELFLNSQFDLSRGEQEGRISFLLIEYGDGALVTLTLR